MCVNNSFENTAIKQDYPTLGVHWRKCYSPIISQNFASIYVTEWEEAALSKSTKSPLLYLRYLDDILIIWPQSKEKCWNFFEILNQQNDNIKLKATISDQFWM